MPPRRPWLVVLAATALMVVAAGVDGRAPVAARRGDPDSAGPATARPAWMPSLTDPVQVSASAAYVRARGVAYNSQQDEYLVVWRTRELVFGRRVSSQGVPIGSAFLIASTDPHEVNPVSVAYDPSRNRYLVVWGQTTSGWRYHLRGRFVPWDGPDATFPLFYIDFDRPALRTEIALAYALAQDEYLVVWEMASLERLSAIVGRRIKADGSGFAAGTMTIYSHSEYTYYISDIAYNLHRNEYLVVTEESGNIVGVRLAGDGTILGGGEFAIAGWPAMEQNPTVAACHSADQYLVAWDSISSDPDGFGVYARLVSGAGVPGIVKPLISSSTTSYLTAQAACGVTGLPLEEPHYLVAWWTAGGGR